MTSSTCQRSRSCSPKATRSSPRACVTTSVRAKGARACCTPPTRNSTRPKCRRGCPGRRAGCSPSRAAYRQQDLTPASHFSPSGCARARATDSVVRCIVGTVGGPTTHPVRALAALQLTIRSKRKCSAAEGGFSNVAPESAAPGLLLWAAAGAKEKPLQRPMGCRGAWSFVDGEAMRAVAVVVSRRRSVLQRC